MVICAFSIGAAAGGSFAPLAWVDFMDIEGVALPVKGASEDMARLAGPIDQTSA